MVKPRRRIDLAGSGFGSPALGGGAVPDWAPAFFDHTYLSVAEAVRSPADTRVEVDLVEARATGGDRSLHVLDLCCGYGRHLAELARRGYTRLSGLDRSGLFLRHAEEVLRGCPVRKMPSGWDGARRTGFVALVQADVREMTFEGVFDVVYNLYSSLAYFEDAAFARVLDRIGRALRPGGCFLLDTVNPILALSHPGDTLVLSKDPLVVERVRHDLARGRLWIRRRMVTAEGEQVRIHMQRLYHLHELVPLFEAAGLGVDGFWGDRVGGPYERDSPRLVVRGRKPADGGRSRR